MSRCFDPQGNPISVEEWSHLFESRMYGSDDWWRVGETEVGDRRVSTVWLGLDHNYWGDGPPLIFESMAFGEGWDDEKVRRYSTWEQAEAGHAAMVAELEAEAKSA